MPSMSWAWAPSYFEASPRTSRRPARAASSRAPTSWPRWLITRTSSFMLCLSVSKSPWYGSSMGGGVSPRAIRLV